MSYKQKIYLAKQFRKKATISEQILWKYLKNRRFMNLKFRRQHPILGFIVDFYCFEYKIAIEIDGPIHEHQKNYDYFREKIISTKGIRIIRFSDIEIENNITLVLDELKHIVLKLKNNK